MKNHIRNQIRQKRRQLDKNFRDQAANSIASKLIAFDDFQQAQHIAFYFAQEGELNTQPIIQQAHSDNKNLYLPILDEKNKTLAFYSYTGDDSLIENKFGIMEPDKNKQLFMVIDQLDIIFLPIVCFDENCNRVGRGAGYYDRTLSFRKNNKKKPLFIGLAYEFQKHAELTPAIWDVPVDYVFTEIGIYRRKEN